jgi:hypothetical protein
MDVGTDRTERIEELRAFLLGTLAETEVERVEYSLLSDDSLYELLLATEEELIDEYLSGSLAESEASSFLEYLNKLPGGGSRMDFAKDLRESLGAGAATPKPLSRHLNRHGTAWAAAALLLAALSVTIYATWTREPGPLVLTAGLMRSEGEIPTATLSASSPTLRVMLDLGIHSHDRYRATLYDAEARALLTSEGLSASVTERRILVAFAIPLAALGPGDYSILLEGEAGLSGNEPVERYVFRLTE